MTDEENDKDLRIFLLIPILANVAFLAGIPFYRDMTAGLAIPLLILPWGITYLAGRLIGFIVTSRATEDDAPEGFI